LTRVAVLAPEPIRPRMAGMGIRALELARALSTEFDVRLLTPGSAEEARRVAGGLPVEETSGASAGWGEDHFDAAIVSGHAATLWFSRRPDVPVAADLYDPFPIENLHYARALGPGTAAHDRAALDLALGRADAFLCASAEQRLFYAGALFESGRIGPDNFPDDPALARLIQIVPFGVPGSAARGDREAGRRAVGARASGPLVLFGGIYDWYEPDLLLAAWPQVLRSHPGAQLLFFENPNPATTPQAAFRKARESARVIDPGGGSILFSPWLDYGARADLYAATDLLVTICSEGLETELSYRTRLLDAAWGGVPSLSVAGGSLARELSSAGAGFECARDASTLAQAAASLLSDEERRRRASEESVRFAATRSWASVAEPLAAWVREARVDPCRLPMPIARRDGLWTRVAQKIGIE
jgi:glycosyltransferase involved in cell wall biosynthesis